MLAAPKAGRRAEEAALHLEHAQDLPDLGVARVAVAVLALERAVQAQKVGVAGARDRRAEPVRRSDEPERRISAAALAHHGGARGTMRDVARAVLPGGLRCHLASRGNLSADPHMLIDVDRFHQGRQRWKLASPRAVRSSAYCSRCTPAAESRGHNRPCAPRSDW